MAYQNRKGIFSIVAWSVCPKRSSHTQHILMCPSPRDIAGARPESGSEGCHSPGISARRAVRDRTIGPDIRGKSAVQGEGKNLQFSEHPPEEMKSTVPVPKTKTKTKTLACADGSQLDQPLISTFPQPPNDINWGNRNVNVIPTGG